MDIRHYFKIFIKPSEEDLPIKLNKSKKTINVFTDGSSFNNGSKTKQKSGGLGIFFQKDDERNRSIKLDKSEPITNNIAELKACIKAIEIILETESKEKEKEELNIIIYTDSEYVINSIVRWAKLWKFNGWRKRVGKNFVDIKNKELIIKLHTLFINNNIRFKHVRAHKQMPLDKTSNEYFEWYGNYMADKLATQASNEI